MLRKVLFFSCLFYAALGFLFSQEKVSFYTDEVILSTNETAVIPFFITEKSKEDKTFATETTNAEVLKQAQVLKDFTIGFCRIKTKAIGQAQLKIANASLKITVVEQRTKASLWQGEPQIQTPVSHSFITEEVIVGVLVLDDFQQNPLTENSVSVKDQNGNTLPFLDCDKTTLSIFRNYRFLLSTKDFPEGTLTLTPYSINTQGRTTKGKEIHVTIIKAENLQKRECEDLTPVENRLKRWGEKNPKLGSSPTASNQKFVVNYSANPANVHPLEIAEAGYYQFYLRAKGDPASGIYPSVGIYVDEEDDFRTSARLVSNTWHRTAVGKPIYLTQGKHQIALSFLNDFAVKQKAIDRNLYLDQFEWQRIPSQWKNTLSELQVAMLNNIHGDFIRDEFKIEAQATWNQSVQKTPPLVNLEINNRIVASTFSNNPSFVVARNQLKLGENKIQISGEFPEDQAKVYSISQTVLCDGITPTNDSRRYFYEFSIHDPVWKDAFQKELEPRGNHSNNALLKTTKEVTIEIPAEIEGDFSIGVNARDNDKRENTFVLSASFGENCHILNNRTQQVVGWWQYAELARVTFSKGVKKITLTMNAEKLQDPETAQFRLKGLVLKRISAEDINPPIATIVYPHDGDNVSGSFMIVVKALDDIKLNTVDVAFDGNPLWQCSNNNGVGAGYYYFMIPEYKNTVGKHTLTALVQDKNENIGESLTITYTAEKTDPLKFSTYKEALLLSQRFGYGADKKIIAQILLKGKQQWLQEMLQETTDRTGIISMREYSEVLFPLYNEYNYPPLSVIQYVAQTSNPVQARFTLWVQNHFTTWLNKTGPQKKRLESNTFFDLGITHFKSLLYTSASSPAMLFYLDQQRSLVGSYNENYARELMELHTLGVDAGYTQQDVTQAALLLTGWIQTRAADLNGQLQQLSDQFTFDPNLNDHQTLKVFGYAFEETNAENAFDRANQLFEMLAAHPMTAKRITKKLLMHYIGETYSTELHEALQKEFLRSGDFKAILFKIATSEDFYQSKPRINSPFDFFIATARKSESLDYWTIFKSLKSSGVGLFDRMTPDGYPDTDEFYSDSNALLQRWKFSDAIQWQLYKNVPEYLHAPKSQSTEDWLREAIQVTTMNTAGEPLDEQSLKSAKDFFATLKGQPYQKMLKLATFIHKLPEINLR